MIRHRITRVVCWLKGHDLERHVASRAQLRIDGVACRRCRRILASRVRPLPRMAVPKHH